MAEFTLDYIGSLCKAFPAGPLERGEKAIFVDVNSNDPADKSQLQGSSEMKNKENPMAPENRRTEFILLNNL